MCLPHGSFCAVLIRWPARTIITVNELTHVLYAYCCCKAKTYEDRCLSVSLLVCSRLFYAAGRYTTSSNEGTSSSTQSSYRSGTSSDSWTGSMERKFRRLVRSARGREMLAAEVQALTERQQLGQRRYKEPGSGVTPRLNRNARVNSLLSKSSGLCVGKINQRGCREGTMGNETRHTREPTTSQRPTLMTSTSRCQACS